METKLFVGVDISEDNLDVAIESQGSKRLLQGHDNGHGKDHIGLVVYYILDKENLFRGQLYITHQYQ